MDIHTRVFDGERQLLKQNIWKLYLYRMLLGMIFPIPTIVLFWQRHGLSLTQVMILQSLFSIAMVVWEVPSGYLADIVGRRITLILAGCANCTAIVIYSAGQHFFHFLAAELCFACGIALISGSDAAMIYDTLQAIGEEHRYQEVYGKLFFYNLFAIGASSVLGGVLTTWHARLPFYATLPFFLGAVALALSFREPPRKQLQAQRGYLRELVNILDYTFRRNERLRWLILYSGVIMGVNNAALWFYQPYFQRCGLKLAHFGLAFASFQVVAALSSKFAHKLEQRLRARASLLLLVPMVAASYLSMGSLVFVFSFTFAWLQQFARGFGRIVITEYINQLTDSDIRATVLSAQNLIMRLLYALLIPIAGQIADATSVVRAFTILGVFTLIAGTGMLLTLHRKHVL